MSNEERLRSALYTVQTELTILNPRLSGGFRTKNEALIEFIKRTLAETALPEKKEG